MPDPNITPDLERAWEASRQDILAAPVKPARSWRFAALRAALRQHLDALQAEASTLTAALSPEAGALFTTRLTEALRLLQAGTFCELQAQREGARTRSILEITARAEAARTIALRNLSILVGLGLFDEDAADVIRRGRGRADLAGDLVALATPLRLHWAVLEPLQLHQPDPAQRLTLASLDALPALAEELLDTDAEATHSTSAIDWNDACRRAAPLLEDTWDQLRFITVGAQAALGHLDLAREVAPSLLAIARRA